jgi:SecD/SecF fusion protein
MKNKGLVIALALVITLLSAYYLSFTYVARNVQQSALNYATEESGIVNLTRKQNYLDSVWNLPVYNFLGIKYTYKEVKDNELSLGLDLQGGMHVVLEVSPLDIIKGMSDNSDDPAFLNTLSKVRKTQSANENISDLFFKTFREDNPDKKLASVFANPATKGKITSSDDDQKIIQVVNDEIEQAIDRSFTILRNRIDQFGTSQPNIQRLPGTGRIQIEIPGAENPQRVRKLLQGVARLEFFDVVEPDAISSSLSQINDFLLKENSAKASGEKSKVRTDSELSTLLGDSSQTKSDTTGEQSKGLDSLQSSSMSGLFSKTVPPGLRYNVDDTAWVNSLFRRPEIQNMLPRNVGIYWTNKPEITQDGTEVLELFFLDKGRNGKARLSGEVIVDAGSALDETGSPSVSMRMNAVGSKTWAKWTAEAAAKTPNGRIAIVLDDKVYSAPGVNGEIPNGNSQITGNFTTEEAKDLANILRAGSLPAPAKIVEEAIIGPTLGKLAQTDGFFSITCGMVLVVVFMIGYYGKSGLVANMSLIFNLFFTLGILAQLDAALTLPGIAGIVLTMGMAVDANVIIYERIREELRQGKRLREAISLGFKRSFWTIFDSNITTFLTALMLYLFGQGPVKGFAITLMVGIVTTFFTAVYISRVVIDWMISNKGDEARLTFVTFISRFVASDLNFNFTGRRKIAYIFSSIFIVSGVVLMSVQGLNLGVDFTGGRTFVVNFNQPVVATDMKVALTKSFNDAGTEVKNYGGNNVVKVTTSYLMEDDHETADEDVKKALIAGLEKSGNFKYSEGSIASEDSFTISSASKVGATIAGDIKAASIKAALFSLLAIYLYILLRFRKWQYSTGAIVSLAHDALFVFAAFAMARAAGLIFEIDQVFVAAILSVIGYSINDTVIIFDRIREYLGMGTSHDKEKIYNQAINSTLNRTLITSGTTLLVVVALLIFGGEVLRGFSFALFVGIGIGTYSSVFIAAPIVLDLEEEKKVERRKLAVQTAK